MNILPDTFLTGVVFVFGLIIGSFLNVVIYRLHTGKSLNDRSHCLSCGHKLSWYELFPVLSFLILRGRCLHCHSFIPYRYALVELLTALGFLLAWQHTHEWMPLIMLLILVSLLVVGAVYDFYHMIILDEIVIGISLVALVFAISNSYLTIGTSLLAGLLAFTPLALLWVVSKGQWIGFGDAKLAFALGMFFNFTEIFSLLTLAFWIGAVTSLLFMAVQTLFDKLNSSFKFTLLGYVRMKSEVPFAPYLIVSFLCVYFFNFDVLNFTSYVFEKIITSI